MEPPLVVVLVLAVPGLGLVAVSGAGLAVCPVQGKIRHTRFDKF